MLQAFGTKRARLLFQASLFITFLYFFGLPAIEKFKRYDVIVTEHAKSSGGIPFPAITITISDQLFGFDYTSCYDQAFEKCIDANSKSWSQVLKGVTLGYARRKSLPLSSDVVKEDFNEIFGKFFTLNMSLKIGPDDAIDQIYIFLYPKYVYQITLHDPDFFIFNENPASIPMPLKYFDTRPNRSYFYNLDLTEVNELDHPGDRCNSSPQYNFKNCIKESVTSKVLLI